MGPTSRLRVQLDGRQFAVGPGAPVDFGRDPRSAVRFDDPLVSRHHLLVHCEGDGWVAVDRGSRNGTFVGERRITREPIDRPVVLRLGDPARGPWVHLAPEPDTAPPTGPDGRPSTTPTATPAPQTGGPTDRKGPARELVRIGRGSDNDLVVDDLLVSRSHAEIRTEPDGTRILVDLDSHNGTFVNGRRVRRAPLARGDVVSVGRHRFRVVADGLEEHVDVGEVAYAALGLTVETRTGHVILDDVSLALDEQSFLGVVGPSGCGKSTLLTALAGFRPASRGSVLYAGRDLYADYEDLRQRIGYVPQDDVLHPELTVTEELEYAAALRFSPDVSGAERSARVREVIAELGLTERRDTPIHHLSGGQRKRVSVALELLTKPTLLFLDEPTSGLDPGYERTLMELFGQLAKGGRTVIVTTHSVASLGLCDRVLCLAPGGRTAYFGPPERTVPYFGRADYQDVFRELAFDTSVDWKHRFEAHPDHTTYLGTPLSRVAAARSGSRAPATPARGAWSRQLAVLTRRYVHVLAADRRNLLLMGLSAPVLGVLMLVALPTGELGPLPFGQIRIVSQASVVLFVLALGMTEIGLAVSVREIVKELPVFRRERAGGLSISAYVASKALVLGVVVAVQAVVLTLLATARQGGPRDAVLLGWGRGELIVTVALTGLAAVALGLLLSATVSTADRAMTLLPVVLIVQMVLASGAVFPAVAERPGLEQAQYLSSAQWGFAAGASTAELNELQVLNNLASEIPVLDLTEPGSALETLLEEHRGNPRWNHESRAWLGSVTALVVLTTALLLCAGLALRRYDPGGW